MRVELVRRGDRRFRVAGKRVADREEVQVVAIVSDEIEAFLGRLGQRFIGAHRGLVHAHGFQIIPRADVDVRRHVDQVARRGRERFQPFRSRERPLRVLRCFDRVNVVVQRADVIGLLRLRSLERCHDF